MLTLLNVKKNTMPYFLYQEKVFKPFWVFSLQGNLPHVPAAQLFWHWGDPPA